MSLYRPFDPDFLQDPYENYAMLPPVYYSSEMRGWVISCYDDVRYVLENPHIFSSSIMKQADGLLLGADGAQHTQARRIVNQFFTRQRVENLKPLIKHITDEILVPLVQQREFDLIHDFADILTIRVIAYIIGIDSGYIKEFIRWSHAYIKRFTTRSTGEAHLLQEFENFFRELIAQRRLYPSEDLISHLILSYDTEDVLKLSMLLVVAGNETTRNLIGNTLRALLEHPPALEAIRRDSSHLQMALYETLRYDSPTQMILRTTTQSTTLHHIEIPTQALVLLVLGAANRDINHFICPHAFDLTRLGQDSLAFGHGVHYCLGAQLAIVEASIALESILKFSIEVLSPYRIANSIQLRGLEGLFIRISQYK
jgi:cytochrome P450